jgi:uncharacterized protein
MTDHMVPSKDTALPKEFGKTGEYEEGKKSREMGAAIFRTPKFWKLRFEYDQSGNKTGTWTYYYENKRVATDRKLSRIISPVGNLGGVFPQ